MFKKYVILSLIICICSCGYAQFKGGVGDGYALCPINRTIVLPIELLNFKISSEDMRVNLNWSTATEVNNECFEIERSVDLILWEKMTRVEGANNSNELIQYEWKDVHPKIGISYYRLRQVDFDGKFSYSKVLSVNVKVEGCMQINVFPNPVSSDIINFNTNFETSFFITMFALTGQLIFQKRVDCSNIELPNLIRGVYTLQFENLNNGDVQYVRIVKE